MLCGVCSFVSLTNRAVSGLLSFGTGDVKFCFGATPSLLLGEHSTGHKFNRANCIIILRMAQVVPVHIVAT